VKYCVFARVLVNFDVIEMNRYDYLVALGAFSVGLAAGRYIWTETCVHKDRTAKEEELNKCADGRNKMSLSQPDSAASGKRIRNPANADEHAVDEEKDFAEVLFFPDHGYTCREFTSDPDGCKNENCQFLHQETNLG
jgi:hypothetical protein